MPCCETIEVSSTHLFVQMNASVLEWGTRYSCVLFHCKLDERFLAGADVRYSERGLRRMAYHEDIPSYVSQTQSPQAFVPWILAAGRIADGVMVAEREVDSRDVEKPNAFYHSAEPVADVVVFNP